MADDRDFSDSEPLRIEAVRHRTEVTIIVDGYLDVATDRAVQRRGNRPIERSLGDG